ncbi:hypothetical protein M431DRAFT_11856 [Trichoderma harzianum CBS 226.95]|uniref:Uncharacterized protein n=1 Tax=Trichoderma harzianum CBS 226.95 TaxID=983964 RepID=A0A2T3ZR61_TRIHA|nr:hypothetical protein M431DRAFT_11856 [Trichoderma harzianum CBS 226.95]PTB47291.1 hypothetical protein M431DRAFT_11856 [Trichoderma harzianum CBS 226.95]
MDEIFNALREEERKQEKGDGDKDKESEDKGSVPFRSPVVSFCTMLSRKQLKVVIIG